MGNRSVPVEKWVRQRQKLFPRCRVKKDWSIFSGLIGIAKLCCWRCILMIFNLFLIFNRLLLFMHALFELVLSVLAYSIFSGLLINYLIPTSVCFTLQNVTHSCLVLPAILT